MIRVTTDESLACSFLKRHIRTKTDLIVPIITNIVHEKESTINSKVKKIRK